MSVPVSANVRQTRRKAFAGSLTGTSLEWYDFSVYSTSAALVFPLLFFPSLDPLTGTLLAFSTYAVGYVARPIGAIVFGRIGDRSGRKRVLVSTLLLIGAATFLVGLLPTYATIGVTAPLLLVALRFAQGVGVGGELGVAVLFSNEHGDARNRGFWSSASQMGPPIGNLLANGVLGILAVLLTKDGFLSYGWRIAFLLSALLVGVGPWIRLKLEDTPVFQAIQDAGEVASAPLRDLFRNEPRGLVAAAPSRLGPDVTYALYTIFFLTYGTLDAGFTRPQVLGAVLIGSATSVVVIPSAGALSDRVRRRNLVAVVAVVAGLWPFVALPAIGGGSFLVLVLVVVSGLFLWALMYGPQGAFITEQFTPKLRSTGSSMGYAIGSVFGGALAPLAFTALLDRFHSWVPIAMYAAAACALSVLGMVLGRDYRLEEDENYLRRATPPDAAHRQA